ncbi:hypothetical protein [Streptomyces sp. NPDC002324]
MRAGFTVFRDAERGRDGAAELAREATLNISGPPELYERAFRCSLESQERPVLKVHRGFEVGDAVGISFALTGPPSLFDATFAGREGQGAPRHEALSVDDPTPRRGPAHQRDHLHRAPPNSAPPIHEDPATRPTPTAARPNGKRVPLSSPRGDVAAITYPAHGEPRRNQ